MKADSFVSRAAHFRCAIELGKSQRPNIFSFFLGGGTSKNQIYIPNATAKLRHEFELIQVSQGRIHTFSIHALVQVLNIHFPHRATLFYTVNFLYVCNAYLLFCPIQVIHF